MTDLFNQCLEQAKKDLKKRYITARVAMYAMAMYHDKKLEKENQ